jgi:hypothetical protein
MRVSRLIARRTEFDRRLGVEEPDILGLESSEQSIGFIGRYRHDDLDGCIGELDEADGMDATVMAEALARCDECCAADTHGSRFLDEPMRKRLPAVPMILLGEESQLETLHRTSAVFSQW